MAPSGNPYFSLISSIRFIFLNFCLVLVLQGCGSSGDDSDPVVSAKPTGYYTGTASVKEDDDSTGLEITDLQGMIHGTRFMLMSKEAVLLYDGEITGITGNNYTADIVVFKNGENPQSFNVTGTIREGVSITGAFQGTGYGRGTFSLSYADSNNEVASIATIQDKIWRGAPNEGMGTKNAFSYDSDGALSNLDDITITVIASCELSSGAAIAIDGNNLYQISVNLTSCSTDTVNSASSGVYTGLATTILKPDPSSPNDPPVLTLVIAFSNGSYSVIGEYQEYIPTPT